MHVLEHQRHRIVRRERHLAGQHLPSHDAHGIQVALRRGFIVLDGFGRQVGCRAQQHAGGRERGGRSDLGQAEIRDLHTPPVVEHDVFGLDVTMHHVRAVRRSEPVEGFADDAQRLAHAESALAVHLMAQVHPVHVFHHQIGQAIGLSGIIHLHDVRVGDLRRGLRLTAEAFDELFAVRAVRQLGMHHLQRHGAVQSLVRGLINRRHTALRDLAHDAIASLD